MHDVTLKCTFKASTSTLDIAILFLKNKLGLGSGVEEQYDAKVMDLKYICQGKLRCEQWSGEQ
jgi:hypothetical protein